MVMRLLLKPLPASWPAPARPPGLRGLLARLRDLAAAVRRHEDVHERLRRAATQALVWQAYQQTLAEQERQRRRPAAFAQAWKNHLTALLAADTVEITGRPAITAADRDPDLAWSLYAAVSRARAEAIARAAATPSRPRHVADSPASWYEFTIAAEDHPLGRVQYTVCQPCGVGLLRGISFPLEWQFCGLGTLALRELETRHPSLTWYTTDQYEHARSFYERYRNRSTSPWTDEPQPCPHV
ncbi:hypothetical protein [Bailinhaonella thermotolerans]|uniref:Uncharacterized protein n=1 Tax=Bailinhaonella thermotolerans TaxID=1070861 RepID=A0A3A4A3W4_9ACTN|nr:hypothetical protein [Bailinhaonella thermotolerans]RJL23165.1 hypothetical protein D5H75_32810 [Bailinhaonella thermotolerans]